MTAYTPEVEEAINQYLRRPNPTFTNIVKGIYTRLDKRLKGLGYDGGDCKRIIEEELEKAGIPKYRRKSMGEKLD